MGVGEQFVGTVDVLTAVGFKEVVEMIGRIGLLDRHGDRVGCRLGREGAQRTQDERAYREDRRCQSRAERHSVRASRMADTLGPRAGIPATQRRARRPRTGSRAGSPIDLRLR